jgi:Zn-dependent M28 family amino/carboxypeptidase
MKDTAALDALTPDQVRGKVLLLVIPPDAQYSVTRGIPNAIIRLDPALVLSVRTHGRGLSAGPRLRDTSAPGAKVPILAVWDPAIQAAVAAAQEATVSVHIPAPAAQPVKLRNVIGVLRGSDPALKDTYLVLTAHYDHLGVRGTGDGDHIYNGANDDASGTSSVVEIAKALASLAQKPRRSIVFITLFGEELGELGSRYYCQHPVFPLAKTVADINLEQLGRTDDTEGPRLLQFNLTGFDYTDIAAFLSKAGEETGIRAVKHEQNSDSFFGRSDNAAFAEAGVPSTTLSVSYIFPDYHRPGDEWPKLDYDNMAKVDDAVALGVFRMADSAEAPRWNKDNPKTARYVEAREKQ